MSFDVSFKLLHEMSRLISWDKYDEKYHHYVVCWICPELRKGKRPSITTEYRTEILVCSLRLFQRYLTLTALYVNEQNSNSAHSGSGIQPGIVWSESP